MRILSATEQESVYGIPAFNTKERKHYFKISALEKDIFDTELKGHASKLYFVLMLGYFKASHQFFHYTLSMVREDAEYIISKYLQQADIAAIDEKVGKKARRNHYTKILKLFSFRFAKHEDRNKMTQKAEDTISIDANPK